MDNELMTVRATKGQIEDFVDSLLWKDMKRELVVWQKGFEGEMKNIADDAATENPSTASVLLHMGDINGRVKAIDYLMELPSIFLQILEDQKNDSKRK